MEIGGEAGGGGAPFEEIEIGGFYFTGGFVGGGLSGGKGCGGIGSALAGGVESAGGLGLEGLQIGQALVHGVDALGDGGRV